MQMRNIFVMVLIFAGILPVACVIEHEDGYASKNGGKQAFSAYEDNMRELVSFVDLAIRMENYLSVPENERPNAEEIYFPDHKIRPAGEQAWAGLQARDTVFRIVTGGQSLFTEGAKWEVYGYGVLFAPAVLTCTGEQRIALEVEGCRGAVWTTDASLSFQCKQETVPENYYAGKWMISGSGKCVSEADYNNRNRILLGFEIIQPLEKDSRSKYIAENGEVSMLVKDLSLKREEKIKAEFKLLPDQSRLLKIFYKGKEHQF